MEGCECGCNNFLHFCFCERVDLQEFRISHVLFYRTLTADHQFLISKTDPKMATAKSTKGKAAPAKGTLHYTIDISWWNEIERLLNSDEAGSQGQDCKESCAAGRALTLFPQDTNKCVFPPTKDPTPATGPKISTQEYTARTSNG